MPDKLLLVDDDPAVLDGFGRLASGLAHELKNPLSAIVMGTKILRRTLVGAGAEQVLLLDAIQKESARLNTILEDFLRFVRPPAPRRTQQDLSALAEEALGSLEMDLRDHSSGPPLEVRRRLGDVPLVRLDRDQIEHVLQQLLSHAAGSTPAGGNLFVTTEPVGSAVQVSVSYPGGDDPSEDVFIAFSSERREGSGLRLPICKRLIEAHGGRIWRERTADGQMTLAFSLPGSATMDGA